MPSSISKTTSKLARQTHGQEIAEAAVVLPLVFMLMLGIFWLGRSTLCHLQRAAGLIRGRPERRRCFKECSAGGQTRSGAV
jgi:hypothetical protein